MVGFLVGLLILVLFLVIVLMILKWAARVLGIVISPEILQILGLILLLGLVIYVATGLTGIGPTWHWRLGP